MWESFKEWWGLAVAGLFVFCAIVLIAWDMDHETYGNLVEKNPDD